MINAGGGHGQNSMCRLLGLRSEVETRTPRVSRSLGENPRRRMKRWLLRKLKACCAQFRLAGMVLHQKGERPPTKEGYAAELRRVKAATAAVRSTEGAQLLRLLYHPQKRSSVDGHERDDDPSDERQTDIATSPRLRLFANGVSSI